MSQHQSVSEQIAAKNATTPHGGELRPAARCHQDRDAGRPTVGQCGAHRPQRRGQEATSRASPPGRPRVASCPSSSSKVKQNITGEPAGVSSCRAGGCHLLPVQGLIASGLEAGVIHTGRDMKQGDNTISCGLQLAPAGVSEVGSSWCRLLHVQELLSGGYW